MTNVETKVVKKEKKVSWFKKHRVGIVKTFTAIGGLVLLGLTYKDGVDKGREEGYDESLKDILITEHDEDDYKIDNL